MKKYKFDFIIIVLLIVITFAAWIIRNHFQQTAGDYVQIYIGDKQIKELPLNTDVQYVVKQKDFTNTVIIRNGKVWVDNANCPDQLCVKQGTIKNHGESVICLPHRVVVRIASGKEEKADEK